MRWELKRISNLFRQWRAKRGFTLDLGAANLGISIAALTDIELGAFKLSVNRHKPEPPPPSNPRRENMRRRFSRRSPKKVATDGSTLARNFLSDRVLTVMMLMERELDVSCINHQYKVAPLPRGKLGDGFHEHLKPANLETALEDAKANFLAENDPEEYHRQYTNENHAI